MNISINHDLSVLEVSELLNYHPETIRRLIRTNRINAYRLNKEFRIPQEEIKRLRSTTAKEVN